MPSRYEILRRLGQGGMAEVFLARTLNEGGFEKVVALKQVLPSMAHLPEARELFLREAQLGARLDHPNIVQVFDGGLAGEQLYLVQEFVDGGDLSEVIEAMRAGKGRLPPEAVAYVGSQVCAALAFLFGLRDEAGERLVQAHRDVSPSNVLVSRTGAVKLSDFGVVRLEHSQTTAGVIRGKWEYFAPEVAKGIVDGRGDLFALGIVLYELATLTHPFEAPSPIDRFHRAQVSDAPRPEGLPGPLWEVLQKALCREVEGRYQTPEALGEALDAYLFKQGTPVTAAVLARQLAPLLRAPVPREPDPDLAARTPLSLNAMDSSPAVGTAPSDTVLSLGKVKAAPPAPAPAPGGPELDTRTLAETALEQALQEQSQPEARPTLAQSSSADLRPTALTAEEGAPPAPRRAGRALGLLGLLGLAGAGAALWGGRVRKPSPPPRADAPLVTIDSVPDESEVYSGSELLGTTPLVLPNDYPPGQIIELTVSHKGFASAPVRFMGGKADHLSVPLKKGR